MTDPDKFSLSLVVNREEEDGKERRTSIIVIRMTLNLVPRADIREPVFLLSWVLITAKVIRASLVHR